MADKLVQPMKLWNYPPAVKSDGTGVPAAEKYYLRQLFVWMPRKMFAFDFKCPNCSRSLNSRGIHNRIRLVMDLKDYYYLATEGMGCSCGRAFVSSDSRLLEQLPFHYRVHLPAILTYHCSCDKSVITLKRSKTLGNSTHALQNTWEKCTVKNG